MDLDDVDSNLWHISDMFKSTWEVGYKGTHEFKKKSEERIMASILRCIMYLLKVAR